MTQHFSRSTIQAELWCKKCRRFTPHRIDSGRKGACLSCIARLELAYRRPGAAQKSIYNPSRPNRRPPVDVHDHILRADRERMAVMTKIEVLLTDESEFHCLKIVVDNPREAGPLELYLHTGQAVDLMHKLGEAICEYFAKSSAELLRQKTGLTNEQLRKQGLIA